MSDQNEREASRLRDMYENARLARQFMNGRSREDLNTDSLLGYGVVRALEVLGEAANHISAETRASMPTIEWANMIGMRNRIVHGYDNIDYDIVWNVVQENLPPLIELLGAFLRSVFTDLDSSSG
ncbi:MAG: DUF86 domain-containing protein [Anaerolineae bacterium]|nr:DUF86 domain-containing protein [Anaerolineae bacterium]